MEFIPVKGLEGSYEINRNGENHHACTRLSEEDAKMIKYGYPDLGDRAVAKIYDIHHAHVYRIRKSLTWKHI